MIHFEFIFVEGIRTVSGCFFFFFFCMSCPVVPAPFVEKTILSPLDCFVPLSKIS